MAVKKFDVRSLNKYFGPQASHDLNRFLEKMPANTGNASLIAGGIVWAAAAAFFLFALLQGQNLAKLRGELEASETLKPIVPVMTLAAVPETDIKGFIDRAKALYPGLIINASGNTVTLQSKDTSTYAQYREAMSFALNGGSGWKVSIKSMCVGRECPQNAIDVSLTIEKISIDKPTPSEEPSENSEPQAETKES